MSALREWRKAENITLEDMAVRFGVSVGSLSRIERGEQWPDREFFERMTEITGLSADDVISTLPQPNQQEKQQ